MAKRSKRNVKSMASSPANFLICDGRSFYYIPAERLGPPMVLSEGDAATVMAQIDALEELIPGSKLVAVKIVADDIPIRLTGHN